MQKKIRGAGVCGSTVGQIFAVLKALGLVSITIPHNAEGNCLLGKPDNVSYIFGTYSGRREQTLENCPVTSTHVP